MEDNMDNKNEVLEKVRYSDEELQEFKEIILKKLEKAREDYEQLRSAITHDASKRHRGYFSHIQSPREGASAFPRKSQDSWPRGSPSLYIHWRQLW